MITHWILSSRYEKLKTKVEKINKRIRRLNKKGHQLSELKIRVLGNKLVHEKTHTLDGTTLLSRRVVELKQVCISGDTPVVKGFRFIAKLESRKGGNIIKNKFHDVDVSSFQYNDCQHCNTRRNRKYTFILQNVEDKSLRQIGSTCLEDYLNNDDIASILHIWDFLEEACTCAIDPDSWYDPQEFECHSSAGYDLRVLTALTLFHVKRYGFASRQQEWETGKTSTASEVIHLLRDKSLMMSDIKDEYEEAGVVCDWMKTFPGTTDYANNVRIMVSDDFVLHEDVATVVSAIWQWLKQKGGEESKYVGELGQRLRGLEVEVKYMFERVSMYGRSYLVIMEDDSGNIYKWGTHNPSEAVKVGARLKLDGTVKEHVKYNGKKQTAITRCKVAG